MRVAWWAVVVGLVLGMGRAMAGEPMRYFSYVEVLTQREFRDSAGNDDPASVDAAKLEEIVNDEWPWKTSEDGRKRTEFAMRLWDMKLLQWYVIALSDMSNNEARQLANRQITWSAERKRRRADAGQAWNNIVRAYTYTTRWRIGRLEEYNGYVVAVDGDVVKEDAGMISAPKMYLPKELLFDLDVEAVDEMVRVHFAKSPRSADDQQEEWRGLRKELWDGQVLVKYIALLRELTVEEGLLLAVEQRHWDEKRFRLYKKFNNSPGGEFDLAEYMEKYLKLTKDRIAELEAKTKALKPKAISEKSVKAGDGPPDLESEEEDEW